MIGKLLENWLDNASERSYQQVFVQMLAANGFKVLHSTRHCTLEYGKDILAVDENGVGCAFQLKGDPKGQMRTSEFRNGIQMQLVQLASQAPQFPGFPSGTHRSFLVSNGSFSEEVQIAVTQMNQTALPSKIELWSRGTLLDMAQKVSDKLWPSEVQDTRRLLDLYMADAKDVLPSEVLAELLTSVLALDAPSHEMPAAQFKRIISSAAWVTGIALVNFAEADNHYAVTQGWTLYRGLIEGAATKYGYSGIAEYKGCCELAESATLDAVVALWQEVKAAKHLVVSPPLEDSVIYDWRMIVLMGLFSSLYLADLERPCLDDDSRQALIDWLGTASTVQPRELWGEGAIGPLFTFSLALMKMGRVTDASRLIYRMAHELVTTNQDESKLALAVPYYRAERAFKMLFHLDGERDKESFDGSSFLARPLLLCLVALGMKNECEALWANFSRLTHRIFQFSSSHAYFSERTHLGKEVSKIYHPTGRWHELEVEAANEEVKRLDSLWLQGLWWQAAPHRTEAGSMLAALKSIAPSPS